MYKRQGIFCRASDMKGRVVMQTLLEKTRKMNQLLRIAATEVDFQASARVVRDSLECNVYILDKFGYVLGYSLVDDFDCQVMKNEVLSESEFPASYNERLYMYRDTAPNLQPEKGKCVFKEGQMCIRDRIYTHVLPEHLKQVYKKAHPRASVQPESQKQPGITREDSEGEIKR